MRVLLVTGSLPPMRCGVGDYTLRLSRALAAEGCEVAILTTMGADALPLEAGVSVFAIMPDWTVSQAGRVRQIIRSWRPDVVHVQIPTFGYGMGFLPYLVPAIARLSGARPVVTTHEISKWDRLYDPHDRSTSARFAALALAGSPFIVVRPGFRKLLHPLFRLLTGANRFRFIPNGSSIGRSALDVDGRAALRAQLANGKQRLLVFFGFLFAEKGADLLFDIADPATDVIVFAGEAPVQSEYVAAIRHRAVSEPWRGQATLFGHRPEAEIADLLAVADTVVLPYRSGGGIWNSSTHAAVAQGTPVVTTATDGPRFDTERNVYFARPDDIADMREAVNRLAQPSVGRATAVLLDDWRRIAVAHMGVYRRSDL